MSTWRMTLPSSTEYVPAYANIVSRSATRSLSGGAAPTGTIRVLTAAAGVGRADALLASLGSHESEIDRAEGREVGKDRRECRRVGAEPASERGGELIDGDRRNPAAQVARIVRPGQRECRHRAVDLAALDGTADDEGMTAPRVICSAAGVGQKVTREVRQGE